MKVIEVEGLSKAYGNVRAVDGISYSVERGQIFGMLGPNGAGKTTTIECTIGLRKYEHGSVKILGMDPAGEREEIFKRIGVQLQETSYQDKIKVKEICRLFESFYSNPAGYVKLLERFGIADKQNSYISSLSGGQKQKLSITLALISNPEVVFLDELTTGLDPQSRRSMWEYIRELRNEGRTVFMTTHYMEEAEYLCDRICIIDNGKIEAMGSVDDVVDSCNIEYRMVFESDSDGIEAVIGEVPRIDRFERDKNRFTVFSRNDRAAGMLINRLETGNMRYGRLDIRRPTLEDAFIKLTGRKAGVGEHE